MKRKKRRLTKFGKLFFGIVFICICSISLFFCFPKNHLYEKKETKNYVIQIEYPHLSDKNLANYTREYIGDKKRQFIDNVQKLELTNDAKYEFKTDYQVNEMDDTVGVHLQVYEYTGGAHYIRNDKSYYYDKKNNKLVTILDFLEGEEALERLGNIAFYYVMQYSQKHNLDFNQDMVKAGLKSEPLNYEYFNFEEDGLKLVFPPYQVAYYAAGEVSIKIPYQELGGIVKQQYLKIEKKDSVSVPKNMRDIKQFMNKKLIAFTFDDGPSNVATNKLLDNLDKYQARVTFFVLGSRVDNYKETLKKAYDMGNLIGSHTYHHKDLLTLSSYDVMKEIRQTNDKMKQIIETDIKYLRPPYGNINAEIKEFSNMYTILWDLDTEDWKYKDQNTIANYIISNAHDGAIVLLHDLYETSVDGALQAMEQLEKEGYAFVTIEEMARIKGLTLNTEENYYQL